MNWIRLINLLWSATPEIIAQIEQLIEFLRYLRDQYLNQPVAMSDRGFEDIADRFPLVVQMVGECETKPGQPIEMQAGIFNGWLRRLLETLNPETIKEYIDLLLTIRDLLKKPG